MTPAGPSYAQLFLATAVVRRGFLFVRYLLVDFCSAASSCLPGYLLRSPVCRFHRDPGFSCGDSAFRARMTAFFGALFPLKLAQSGSLGERILSEWFWFS